jgi:UDPglucose 6-dehydrogenase
VRAYDPAAGHQARTLLPQLALADSIAEAVRGTDAVVILTEWSAFRAVPWKKLAPTMRRPLLIDLRNLYEAPDLIRQGLDYVPLGRQEAESAGYRAAAE